MDYEKKMYIILDLFINKINQMHELFNNFLTQFNEVQEQYIDFIDKSKTFQIKRDEYINNTAECENINRMNFYELEKHFKMYQNIILINIDLLNKPFYDLNKSNYEIKRIYEKYLTFLNKIKDNKLVKLKDIMTLEMFLYKCFFEFLDYYKMTLEVNKIYSELSLYVNTSDVYYHDDKINNDEFFK